MWAVEFQAFCDALAVIFFQFMMLIFFPFVSRHRRGWPSLVMVQLLSIDLLILTPALLVKFSFPRSALPFCWVVVCNKRRLARAPTRVPRKVYDNERCFPFMSHTLRMANLSVTTRFVVKEITDLCPNRNSWVETARELYP